MRKLLWYTVYLVLFLLMLSPSDTFGQTAKDAIMALKKIEARCQAGISYRDYAPVLGEAKFVVNVFLESKDAKDYPEIAKMIDETINHYETVKSVWDYKFSGYQGIEYYICPKGKLGKHLLEKYVDANNLTADGGAIELNSICVGGRAIDIQTMKNIILNEASKELKDATNRLSTLEAPSASFNPVVERLRKEIEVLKSEIDSLIKVNEILQNKITSLKLKNK